MSQLPLPVLLLTIWVCATTTAQFTWLSPKTEEADEAILYVPTPTCKTVRRMRGVNYDDNDTDVNFEHLTLKFINKDINLSYKLTSAAEMIPTTPWLRPDANVKVYIHGFTDDPNRKIYETIDETFLTSGDVNIVALDASSLMKWFYFSSHTIVQFIGEELGKLLATIVKAGISPGNIHLIGHSLGGHIAGFAGQTFFNMTGSKVGRITALDPAGICFTEIYNVTKVLHATDAEFVDVIHTDGPRFGLMFPVGHADFFPNSGGRQPGCKKEPYACSHSRAWLLFMESIKNPKAFPAANCKDWKSFVQKRCTEKTWMGYECPTTARGKFYLKTGEQAPYSLGEKGATFISSWETLFKFPKK